MLNLLQLPLKKYVMWDLLNYYSYCDKYEISCELIFRLMLYLLGSHKYVHWTALEYLLKTDLSYMHFDFQVARLMDNKPIEVLDV